MQRWQEQKEQKLAELLRTIRSFVKMEKAWTELASTDIPGHRAYAKQKAAMFQRRTAKARQLVAAAGYRDLLEENANIIHTVQTERDKEAKIVAEAISVSNVG